MKRRLVYAGLVLLAIAAALFPWATTIHAEDVVATISVPSDLTLGKATDVTVTLKSAGEPVRDTLVTLYSEASFAGVSGEIEIGTGHTDADGVAVIQYEPRRSGPQELRIQYEVPDDTGPGTESATVSVVGNSQLHQSESGIQVPGLNVWLIVGVVGGVWLLLVSVGWRVFRIAREGADAALDAAGQLSETGGGES